MQGEHCLLNPGIARTGVHVQVRREGERFIRFSKLLLLTLKLPNIDKDQTLLKQSLRSVRSFFLQDIFPIYTLTTGADELFIWLQSFFKEIQWSQFSELLNQWQHWHTQIKTLLEQSFDEFIVIVWQKLQLTLNFTMYSCYQAWLEICDNVLQKISAIMLTALNRPLTANTPTWMQAC